VNSEAIAGSGKDNATKDDILKYKLAIQKINCKNHVLEPVVST
jgi:hypothetical protein